MKIGLSNRLISYDLFHMMNSYRQLVKKHFHVLEIGASNRELTGDLSTYCQQLTGIERFPERCPRSFGNVRYLVGDWERLSDFVEPLSVDLAVARHVIEHVHDDLGALNELYDTLKPGGAAIINTPNRKRLARVIIEVVSGERRFPYWEHQREYTRHDLEKLIHLSKFNRFKIFPLVFGLHGGRFHIYLETPPAPMEKYAGFWEFHLFKPI